MRFAATLPLLPALLYAQSTARLTPDQLIDAGRFVEAKGTVHALLSKNSRDPNAVFLMGRLARAEEDAAGAVAWFEKAVQLDERNARYHTWLGNALGDERYFSSTSKLRQPFLARRVKSELERAVELDPAEIDAREGLVGFYMNAPRLLGGSMVKARGQAVEIGKLDPVRGHLQFARIAERSKDTSTAEVEYKAAIAAAPARTQAYYELGTYYRGRGEWMNAFEVYERLMILQPAELTVHLTWAGTSAQSGKNLERGEREVKLFLASAPAEAPIANVSNAHWRLGQIYEQTGRRELAANEYLLAIAMNNKSNAKRSLEALRKSQ
jgi:tetratricopeptide (TPR) repeat protein